MEIESNQKTKDKMAVPSPHLSINILKVNGFNSPIKRHRVVGWIKDKTLPLQKNIYEKQDPTIYSLQETHLSFKDKHRLKMKRTQAYYYRKSSNHKTKKEEQNR